MAEVQHIIGKCVIQIDVSDRHLATAVFERISDLSKVRLPLIINTILEGIGYPSDKFLKFDRIVVQLGTLSIAHFESEFLGSLEKVLVESLQKYSQGPGGFISAIPRKDQFLNLLEFLLLHGRYPWWASGPEYATKDLSALFSRLSGNSEKLATLLQYLGKDPAVWQRLMYQVFKQEKSRISLLSVLLTGPTRRLDVLIQKTIADIAQKKSLQYAESVVWKAVIKATVVYAGKPVTSPAFRAYLRYELSENKASPNQIKQPEAAIQEQIPQHNTIPQIAILPALIFFLESGRLPEGIMLHQNELESILLQWLQNHPAKSKIVLLQINRKVNLAGRLAQQFSIASIQAVLMTLFSDQWTKLEEVLSDFLRITSGKISAQFIWQTVAVQLLQYPEKRIHLLGLINSLVEQVAEKAGTPVNQFWSEHLLSTQLQKKFSPTTRYYIQLIFSQLTPSEHTVLYQQINSWGTKKGASAPSMAAWRLLWFLENGTPAWWDQQGMNTAALLEEMTALPSAELRNALQSVWKESFREKWLPEMSTVVFFRILQVFKGDIASRITAFIQALEKVATEHNIDLKRDDLQEFILERILFSPKIHYPTVIVDALEKITAQSGRSKANWLTWLRPLIESRVWNELITTSSSTTNAFDADTERQDLTDSSSLTTNEFHTNTETQKKEKNLPYRALVQKELYLIWCFLREGSMPPGEAVTHAEDLEFIILRLLQKHTDLLLQVVCHALRNKDAVNRLLTFFSDRLWRELGQALAGRKFIELQSQWDDLLLHLQTPLYQSDRRSLDQLFFFSLFSSIGMRVKDHQKEDAAYTTIDLQSREILADALQMVAKEEHIPAEQLLKFLEKPVVKQKSNLQSVLPEIKKDLTPLSHFFDERIPITEESLFIQNAGLVILAPYLNRYFDTLGMLENGKFKTPDAAERGVHLLQYLATHQTETPEYLLVFNKILCGLPIGTPVSAGIELTTSEVEVSAFLLHTVIHNWEIMKNSSVSNVQASFILREGRLQEKPDRWLLDIERKSLDILLDSIPWTFSMIKLPWMEKRTEVTWNKK